MFFKCKHRAIDLAVRHNATESVIDEDYVRVTYHLFCNRCYAPVTLTYIKLRKTIDAFMREIR